MQRQAKKKNRWLKIVGIILLLLIATGAGATYYVYHTIQKSADSMYTPIERDSTKREGDSVEPSAGDPFSVLVLGVDERENDAGRSDSMILLTINPTEETVNMISIPRDTRTEIVGRGTVEKINHAYAYGGIEMTLDTVENFLDVPIDYYVEVNMEGFKDIVDAVGGVTVDNTLDFTYEGTHFKTGTIQLNGEEALKYSRMRKEDPNGDFGRQARQRQVITAIIREGASMSSLLNYKDILNSITDNVQTNLTFDEMVSIQKNYKLALNNVTEMTLAGEGAMIDNIYYHIVSDEEKERIHNLIVQSLDLEA